MTSERAKDVGILAIEMYFPSFYVEQSDLEKFDGVSEGKYTIGLRQKRMAVVSDAEDIHTFCLTVVHNLLEQVKLSPNDVGFLMVGTETLIDEIKSVKSTVMQLFTEFGNSDIQGSDTTNACYGGTAALFHAVDWIESSNWDGRYAVVVAADIALYNKGRARPTSGAGAIAMLIGPNAPLMIESPLRSTHMSHAYDFYKPELSSEYPYVDGKLSIECYYDAFDKCYTLFKDKYKKKCGLDHFDLDDFSGLLFHTPYCKIVAKTVARLILNECIENSLYFQENYCDIEKLNKLELAKKFQNRKVEETFIKMSESLYENKVKPGLSLSTELGNMYTASLYCCLISFLLNKLPYELKGSRLLMFSYGSGLAASIFSIKITDYSHSDSALRKLIFGLRHIAGRLNTRIRQSAQQFVDTMKHRENIHKEVPYKPTTLDILHFNGTYILTEIDEKHRRHYKRMNHEFSVESTA
ncbi:hydroxymethylglutaryl-CoA synthase: cytoplasmic-like isoform X2 [Leptotrombidium deliense]|uniref:Hydroxymethylglutaryl-CoA synthase n=1 Tax=Leptotrombidium deliense TaxID=299467 RepID=A0A443S548_9ACAR|nr:hydroxymethylglutaryl-CoA synthase: cytoplasmic-like isoform X2 [Leptotrombidium deliense]